MSNVIPSGQTVINAPTYSYTMALASMAISIGIMGTVTYFAAKAGAKAAARPNPDFARSPYAPSYGSPSRLYAPSRSR